MTQAMLEGRYAPRDGSVLSREVAEELVIVDMQKGLYHGLNKVGAEIWQAMDGERTLAEITDVLTARYPDVERATLEADALALTQALLDNELVVAR